MDYQNMQVDAATEQSMVEDIHLDESTDEVATGSAEHAGGQNCDRAKN